MTKPTHQIAQQTEQPIEKASKQTEISTATEQDISQDINDYVSVQELIAYADACHKSNDYSWQLVNDECLRDPRKLSLNYALSELNDLSYDIPNSERFIKLYTVKKGIKNKIETIAKYDNEDLGQDENNGVMGVYTFEMLIETLKYGVFSEEDLYSSNGDFHNLYITRTIAEEVFFYPKKDTQSGAPENFLQEIEQLNQELQAKDEEIEDLKKENKKLQKKGSKHFYEESYSLVILALLERLTPKGGKIIPIMKTQGKDKRKINISDLARKINDTIDAEITKYSGKDSFPDRTKTFRDMLSQNVIEGIEFTDE